MLQEKENTPMPASGLTHFDPGGRAIMSDIGGKDVTRRHALAEGFLILSRLALDAVLQGAAGKGDVLGVARVAGIMAAKRADSIIPLCHPLSLTRCVIDFEPDEGACQIRAVCAAEATGRTGVEMEALTGVTVALLTIYDMCKAIDRGMVITGVRLLEKSGGKSGNYVNRPDWTGHEGD